MRTQNPSFLTREETGRIVRRISPEFAEYVQKFDERKYPPREYQALLGAFATPRNAAAYIRRALVWKWGHTGKSEIPRTHNALIAEVQRKWSGLVRKLEGSPEDLFANLITVLEKRTRYITVTFLIHLLKPKESPIIDQHNFRAMNYFLKKLRPEWRSKKAPSQFSDVVMLGSFMDGVIDSWRSANPCTAPTRGDLDKFLMMFGKKLKARKSKTKSKAKNPSKHPARTPERADNLYPTGTAVRIRLPFGGANRSFTVSKLVRHIQDSKHDFIIQGQTNCTFSQHPKPSSLDYWLRENFAENRDTRQATKEVINKLVDTELFERGKFKCPVSGRRCAGIRLIAQPRVPVLENQAS